MPPECPDGQPASTDRIELELVFVVDNSGSMLLEQERLHAAFPELLRALLSGDLDGDGEAEFAHADTTHVHVRTTDRGSPTGRVCPVDTRYVGESDSIDLPATAAEVSAFVRRAARLAVVGDQGCIYEQSFDAAIAAALDLGRAEPSSILGIVLVTDEDDCSVEDRSLFRFDDEATRDAEMDPTGELRCFLHPEMLFPPRHFVEQFRRLRPFAENVVVGAITGVPPELASAPGPIAAHAILRHPQMQQVRDEAHPWRLEPSCDDEESYAEPPRRIVELLGEFGERASVQSICATDFRPALLAIAERIGYAIEHRRCQE